MSDNLENTSVPPAETIDDFRLGEALSKASFYKLKKLGLAPHTYHVPGTKIVRVIESHDSWRERMATLSASKAGELETARRRELASEAGKRAAASPDHACRNPRKRRHRAGERARHE